ncbi:MAG: pgk [Myxococcaceae bacterium]|nr:pgk [Myxococcaceae bacterium]
MSSPVRSLNDVDVTGRSVFVRVDFNVPLDGTKVTDDTRIRAAIPTILNIQERGGRVVLASHLGRPKGADPLLSLEPAALRLAELMNMEVLLSDDCIGDGARKVVTDLREGQIAMLENLRFHKEEEADDELFARELAKLCEIYVNDAFGCCHRAHASVHALPKLMPQRAAGLLVHKEVAALELLRGNPERPYVAVLGGAKVSDKIKVIEVLMERVDELLIGGAMANTFLAAQGLNVGKSRIEEDKLPLARTLLIKARERNIQLLLPVDVVVADSIKATKGSPTDVAAIGEFEMALDIGPRTVKAYGDRLRRAKSVFWNGPMGLFENPAFSEGSFGVARAMADCTGFTVVGGGDSVAAVQVAGLTERYTHVSTGGGASLELLEGKKLPGVEVLRA